jgi:phage gp16-like protein
MLEVVERRGLKVVHADDAVATLEQLLAEMRAEEAGPTGDNGSGHGDSC